MPRPRAGAAPRRTGGAGRRARGAARGRRVRAGGRGRARLSAASPRPRAREVASTSSSTVPATIVELDHCGTHATRREVQARGPRCGVRAGRHGVARRAPARSRRAPRRHRRSGRAVRKPARACSTVDLPDPLGPTRAVRRAGAGVERARSARRRGGCGRCRRPAAWCARRRRAARGEGCRVRQPRRRGATRAGSTGTGSGGPSPGTQMPIASSRSRSLARVARTGPSATTRPSAESTTSRSTRSTHGPEHVLDDDEGRRAATGGLRPGGRSATGRPARRQRGHGVAHLLRRRRGRASPSARRGARPTGRAPASRRARAAGSARRTAPTSGCRAAGRPDRPHASAEATTPAISARGIRTFSGPKATSRPTDAATTPAPGSCSTSPTAPGRLPRRDAVDGHRAGELAGVDRLEEPREGAQQGRLARARGPDEQHPLARPQGQRDVAQHRFAPAERPPGERVDLDPPRAAGRRRRRRGAVDGVRQRAAPGAPGRPGRPTAHPPGPGPARAASRRSPASTAPETAMAPR